MALFWPSDGAWAAIEPHLPRNQPGTRRVDDRRVISGIVHVLKIGCRWCECPADYGPSTTIYDQFNRWPRGGFWLRLLDALVDAGNVSDVRAAPALLERAGRMRYLLADKGYDADQLRRSLRDAGAVLVIAGRPNRSGRHLIEKAFYRLKDVCRVAARYDKLAANFLSGVATALAFWL